jgi:hypothetical protein
MKLLSLSMLNKNFKVGDSVSLYYDNNLIAKGIIYIYGSIPIEKFYLRKYSSFNNKYDINNMNDVYEDALVLIDNNNAEKLIVLTLENDDHKLFVWNDIFDNDKDFKYQKIPNLSSINIVHNEVILTEIFYQIK